MKILNMNIIMILNNILHAQALSLSHLRGIGEVRRAQSLLQHRSIYDF